jgi:hypothetical protein
MNTAPLNSERQTNVLWWAVPAATIVLMSLLVMFGVVEPPKPPPPRQIDDASDSGIRAAYLLLDELGYRVTLKRQAKGVRWVLFPAMIHHEAEDDGTPANHSSRGRSKRDDVEDAAAWVRGGGTLLLADDSTAFAAKLGLHAAPVWGADEALSIKTDLQAPPLRLSPGPLRIDVSERPDGAWPTRGEPLVSIFQRGRGQIWLVQRPEVFRNERIRDADNAVVICRLADAITHDGAEPIQFDEFHRVKPDRPSAVELLTRPPLLWATLHGIAAVALLLWRFMPRFGPLIPALTSRRRSKEEFLDAMANLLERKGAYAEAYEIVRNALRRDLEQALGAPAKTPPSDLAEQASRRWPGLNEERLLALLSDRQLPRGHYDFVVAINELERLRRECIHE